MKNTTVILLSTLAFFLSISSCCTDNSCTSSYIIEGFVTSASDNTPCVGFEIELEEKVVEGGMLNSFFETAGTATTDAQGYYRIEFPRRSVVEFKIKVEKEGWFPFTKSIDPELFLPDSPVENNMQTTPRADLDLRVINLPPTTEDDKMRVRLLKTFEQYSTCDAEWRVFFGKDIDTTLSCITPGDVWMPYLSIDQTDPEAEVTIIDSVYCPSFEITTINVLY